MLLADNLDSMPVPNSQNSKSSPGPRSTTLRVNARNPRKRDSGIEASTSHYVNGHDSGNSTSHSTDEIQKSRNRDKNSVKPKTTATGKKRTSSRKRLSKIQF